MIESNIVQDGGSFRDPASCVFHCDGQVYRAVDAPTLNAFSELKERGFTGAAIERGALVDTEIVADDDERLMAFRSRFPDAKAFLRHARLESITYPYEWSFSMLCDAALLQLDLQLALLDFGYSLKDASAFNVQFVGSKPVFIDVGSFERPGRYELWYAYGQFCRMFLYPLILAKKRRIGFREIFMAGLDGVTADKAAAWLGWWKCLSPVAFVDLFLQHLLSKGQKFDAVPSRSKRTEKTAFKPGAADVQKMNLRRLRRKVLGLRKSYMPRGMWSRYESIRNYSDDAVRQKHDIVQSILDRIHPKTVLDMGCNTGEFSVLAAKSGARVIAVDADHDAVECLYRSSQTSGLNILPLVANIAEPSPGVGLLNREREPLLERLSGECVFALALIHHLLVAAGLPLAAIVKVFSLLTETYLVIEYVDMQDSMFQILLAGKPSLVLEFDEAKMLSAFSSEFELVERYPIAASSRCILLFRKNGR